MAASLPPCDFQSVFQSCPGLYLVLTTNYRIIAVSDAYLRATMTQRDQILGRGIFDVFPDNPDDPYATGVRNLSASLARVLQNKAPDTMAIQKYDIRKPEAEGGGFEERFWSPVNSPVLNDKNEVIYIVHQVEDVTELIRLRQREDNEAQLTQDLKAQTKLNVELSRLVKELRSESEQRKRAEERSRKAEEKFALAFRSTPDSIAVNTLKDGRYVEVNDAFVRLTGFARDQVIGRTNKDLKVWVAPSARAKMIELLRRDGRIENFEFQFRTKGGEVRTGLRSAELIRIDGEECIVGITRDVTDRKQLEEQLRKAQKMEAVGQLAGGIAHDFNNLLGVILGYAEMVGESQPVDDRGKRMLREIEEAAQRAAAVTRQLLAFSRQQVLENVVLDLNVLCERSQAFLRRLIPENIEFTFRGAPEPALVRADPTQIDLVLMNLAVNARDAMPRGGKLSLEIQQVQLDEAYAGKHFPVKPGRFIQLTVTDTGVGMDAETQARIFEPFFTTKDREKGTGLGLATVYGIVKQSGGFIWVYSELDRGAIFKIYLPQVTEQVTKPLQPEKLPSLTGDETILLVEDSSVLRKLYCNSLAMLGYTVLEAENSAAAMEIVKRSDGIHLLLTDIMMPGMNGRELAETLRKSRPQMKVIYMSGYAQEGAAPGHNLSAPGTYFLQKPFSTLELGRKIRQALMNS